MTKNRIVVIVPTYNEKDNIAKLINEVNRLGFVLDILIVDDNSPDGTGRVAESLKEKNPNLDIMHRKRKEGLGPAYIDAFRYVLNKKQYDYIVNMDSDFSHSPKEIHKLLEAAKLCDVVVGSRYVKGGGVSDEWNVFRKILSKFGNFYARFITGLKLRDCTSGFRCYKSSVLMSVNLNKKFLNGYGFLIQMLYEASKQGARIHEIPIFFDKRLTGASKMDLTIMLEACFSLLALRLKSIFFNQ